jgi:hypothetical protein
MPMEHCGGGGKMHAGEQECGTQATVPVLLQALLLRLASHSWRRPV